jgi:hypothetical protein
MGQGDSTLTQERCNDLGQSQELREAHGPCQEPKHPAVGKHQAEPKPTQATCEKTRRRQMVPGAFHQGAELHSGGANGFAIAADQARVKGFHAILIGL